MGITKWISEWRAGMPARVSQIRKAAENGLVAAQCDLGRCYLQGEGVHQNQAEAVKWYRKAAVQGFAEAQFLLGNCYYAGRGVSQSHDEALRWYRQAAAKGHLGAQSILGIWGER